MTYTPFWLTSIKHSSHLPFYWHKQFWMVVFFVWSNVYFRMFPNIMCNVNSNQCFRMPCTKFLLTSIKHSAHLPFYWQKRFEWFYGLMSAIHKWNQCKTFLAEIEIHLRCRNASISIQPVAIDFKQAEKKIIESVLHIFI